MRVPSFQDQGQVDRKGIEELVISSLREILSEICEKGQGQADSLSGKTRLIGSSAVIDSMGLVTLIVNIEQTLNDQDGVLVTIADERALSQENSPFRTVDTLTDYVTALLQER